MMLNRLSEIAAVLGAPLTGEDVAITGAAIDTRKLAAGNLFVALAGSRVDGHDFIAQAKAAGAAAVLVERAGDYPLPSIRVASGRAALAEIGRACRRRAAARVVGITGSNGKTTVKEMTASILRQAGDTLHTQGNLNNELGLPLTLTRLEPKHAFAVIEMGASALGEIDTLARIAEPEIAVVTNAGAAHLEGFGSLEGVARGKGELFAALGADGIACINADDRFADYWRGLAGARRVVDFGIDAQAAVRALEFDGAGGFLLQTPDGQAPVKLPMPGRHNVLNALAAAAVGYGFGLPVATLAAGLAATPVVAGRLNVKPGHNGARLIDDSYNANPNSLRAGLEVLSGLPGERWLILGDMGELGPEAAELHARVGEWALAARVSRLLAVGELSAEAVRRFGCGGEHFPTKDALVEAALARLTPEVVALVKGSRFMAMDQVAAALAADGAAAPVGK